MVQGRVQEPRDGEHAANDSTERSEEVKKRFGSLAHFDHHRRKLVHEEHARKARIAGQQRNLLLVLRYRILTVGGEWMEG